MRHLKPSLGMSRQLSIVDARIACPLTPAQLHCICQDIWSWKTSRRQSLIEDIACQELRIWRRISEQRGISEGGKIRTIKSYEGQWNGQLIDYAGEGLDPSSLAEIQPDRNMDEKIALYGSGMGIQYWPILFAMPQRTDVRRPGWLDQSSSKRLILPSPNLLVEK